MKVDYKCILESYERSNQEFLEDCMEIATEAEALNTTNVGAQNTNASNSTINQVQGKIGQTVDTTNQKNQLEPGSKQKQNFLQRIQQIIRKIIQKISEVSIKIMNRIKLMMESDKAFFNVLHQRRAQQKPLQNFKAITYTYNDQYLDSTVSGIRKLVFGTIQQLGNFTGTSSDPKIKQIIEADQSTCVNNLLSFFTKDKNREGGPDVQSFTKEMIDTFRGEKKEQMWNQSSIPTLINQAKGTNELSNECNAMIRECKNSVNQLKAIEAKARIQRTSEDLMNISRRVNKAVAIYNAFLAIARMYYEMKLEQSLSARMLLKKFYQF